MLLPTMVQCIKADFVLDVRQNAVRGGDELDGSLHALSVTQVAGARGQEGVVVLVGEHGGVLVALACLVGRCDDHCLEFAR